jgi:alpha-mannosidase
VEQSFEGSTLVQDVLVRPGSARVEVRCTLTWNERWRALKLRMPVAVSDPSPTFEVGYGVLQRDPTGHEVPAQRWLDVTGRLDGGRTGGVVVVNDSKHGFDVDGAEIGMTVVRSPIYAHHEPYLPLPGEDHVWQDQGGQQFRYLLIPHADGWRSALPMRAAAELNERPVTLIETGHDGVLALSGSFASVEPDHVDLVVLKRAEDSRELVVRLAETTGQAATARLELPLLGRSDHVLIGPWELLTFIVPLEADLPLRPVNLLEWAG